MIMDVVTPGRTQLDLLDTLTFAGREAGLPTADALFTANPDLPLIVPVAQYA
jgi:hypothetical protein